MQAEYDFSRARQGRIVPSSAKKTRITIRLDTDILNWFRDQVEAAGGGSYQRLINDALRAYVESQQKDLEATLRKVIREELELAGVSKQEVSV
ncbi:MAG: BrnA antitoxin family protein [Chloroflexi bacterium]|nr:BrnA antitoxin family protein [Chloroflexota bacterium]